ncbi:hypothetical protein [Segatella oulorum]|uniref:hypothetical protein n=1 Tax=Segatella oulorum TaxID=28136 RepID=UPI0028EC894C|nr:hypothetical protein [Segatella oulorum]
MEESKRALNAPVDTPSARKGIGNAAHMWPFRISIDTFLHADDFLLGDKNVTKCLKNIFFLILFGAYFEKLYLCFRIQKEYLSGRMLASTRQRND